MARSDGSARENNGGQNTCSNSNGCFCDGAGTVPSNVARFALVFAKGVTL
jgi:hypothetical protein